MVTGLALEETELRLGLPGGGEAEAAKNPGKRGYEDTVNIDLKLQLQTSADAKLASAEAAEKVKKSAGHHNAVACSSVVDSPEKPSAPKAQVVGWPPVRSFRKKILKSTAEDAAAGEKFGNSPPAALVKVSMDGAPYLRKLDLKACGSYQDLSIALRKMFSSFTTGTGEMSGRDFMNERKVMDLLNGSEFVPTYEDKDGDWMLIGDVPWEMFVDSCKRLRIMKGSEAIGLAPRAMEKCKNRG